MTGLPKATRLTNLFEGHRREAFLVQWTHLKTKAGEERVKMDMRIPLLNQSLIGMNMDISEPFTLMAKEDSKTARAMVNVDMEGMTMELFTTDRSKAPELSNTGVKMVRFYLSAAGEGEKKEVNLHFYAYIPGGEMVRNWCGKHLHATFFLEAVYSQSEMAFGEPVEDEDEDDDEVPEPVAASPAAKRNKKSGPQDLAAYHAGVN